ncbi:hypothetical protein Q8A73_001901 [Channa argus]|nr:hypothetical protein Q8A73_001901 [Channa argus]
MLKRSSSSGVFIDTLSIIFILYLFIQTSGQKRIYFYVQDKLTQSEAKHYCREHYADLATFRNGDDIDAVSAQHHHDGDGVFSWIGLQRNENDRHVWNWSDGETSDFRRWDNEEPNNLGGEENCVAMKKGVWTDLSCYHEYPSLCYEDETILVQENKTWEEALEYCRNLDPLYSLLNINFVGFDLIAKKLIQDAQTQEVWIGLRFLAGNWLSVNGKPLSNQLPVCPPAGKNCGTVAKMGDVVQFSNCSEKNHFICSYNPVHV